MTPLPGGSYLLLFLQIELEFVNVHVDFCERIKTGKPEEKPSDQEGNFLFIWNICFIVYLHWP